MSPETIASECAAIARWENEGGPALASRIETSRSRDQKLELTEKLGGSYGRGKNTGVKERPLNRERTG
jgi:hypothetical protein